MNRTFDDINSMEHGLIISSGSGKTGKSTALHSLAETIPSLRSRKKVFYDAVKFDASIYPGYRLVHTLDDIPPGSLCFIEDMIRLFASRGSSRNSTLPEWLGLISHKDIIVMISTQNYSDLDKAILRSQKVVSIHSYMYENDLPFERDEIRLQQALANLEIAHHIAAHPDIDPRAFKFCPEYNETFALDVPSWWSKKHSKMFREVAVCR